MDGKVANYKRYRISIGCGGWQDRYNIEVQVPGGTTLEDTARAIRGAIDTLVPIMLSDAEQP